MTRKKPLFSTLPALILASCISAPAHAALFLEGLEPFSMRHCDDTPRPERRDTTISDPVVLSPAEAKKERERAARDFREPCPAEAGSKGPRLPPK